MGVERGAVTVVSLGVTLVSDTVSEAGLLWIRGRSLILSPDQAYLALDVLSFASFVAHSVLLNWTPFHDGDTTSGRVESRPSV